MKPRLLTLVLTLFIFQLQAADYYWVGGGGNWSQLSHWRLNSPAAAFPVLCLLLPIMCTSLPAVVLVQQWHHGPSFWMQTGFCNNFAWTNVANNPIFSTCSAAFTMEVRGNMILSPAAHSYNCHFKFGRTTPPPLPLTVPYWGNFALRSTNPAAAMTVADSLIIPSYYRCAFCLDFPDLRHIQCCRQKKNMAFALAAKTPIPDQWI